MLHVKNFSGAQENVLETPHNVPIYFTPYQKVWRREEDPSTRMILEGGTTFRWVYMHKFLSVWLTVEKELKMNNYPLNNLPPFFEWIVPSSGIFLAKAVYLVLGSSYLSVTEILVPGTSATFACKLKQKTYGARMICLLGSSSLQVNTP